MRAYLRSHGLELLAVVFCFGLALGVWRLQATVEARTYNRLTGSDVTVWEAMWTQLRVDCP